MTFKWAGHVVLAVILATAVGCQADNSATSASSADPAAVPSATSSAVPSVVPSAVSKAKPVGSTRRKPAVRHHRTKAAPVPVHHSKKVVHRAPAPPANPTGATARCNDGTLSYSQHRRGTCSHHHGVAVWF